MTAKETLQVITICQSQVVCENLYIMNVCNKIYAHICTEWHLISAYKRMVVVHNSCYVVQVILH